MESGRGGTQGGVGVAMRCMLRVRAREPFGLGMRSVKSTFPDFVVCARS